MSENLPVRSMKEILQADPEKLNATELAIREEWDAAGKEEDESTAYKRKPLRVKIAHAHQMFVLPDESTTKTLEVIILGAMVTRGYWTGSGDDSELLCSSLGGMIGRATEKGEAQTEFLKHMKDNHCTGCMADQWGTGKDGKGKACKEMRRMLCFHPDYKDLLLLNASPMSLNNHDDYYSKIQGTGEKVCRVWTRLGLDKAQRGAEVYSQLTYERLRMIDPEDLLATRDLRKLFAEFLSKSVEDDDYQTTNGGGGSTGAPSGVDVTQSVSEPSQVDGDQPPPPNDDDDLPF